MGRYPQQTIKLAIDCDTGELVSAESLLSLEEVEFTALRRTAMEARNERKRGGSRVRFLCAICKHPVYLARYKRTYKNRWFVHDGKSEDCPWHENNRLTPEQVKALVYRGQQEGAAHKALKQFLAKWLEQDPLVSKVNLEQTTYSEVLKNEWRRPDVKCEYQGRSIVFEIQLSYTFLSEVIARDEFYKREGIFIIWVFALFDLNRAAVTDEAFFNRRNLFILDAEAINQTEESGRLVFNGYRQEPKLIDKQICDEWENKPVNLADVIFPIDSYRPYFFDYDVARQAVASLQAQTCQVQPSLFGYEAESKMIESLQAKSRLIGKIDDYLNAAVRYYDSDYSAVMKAVLLENAGILSSEIPTFDGLSLLRDERFFGYHEILPVLLSVKLNRSVGFDKSLSVFQVIEAGLRNSFGTNGKQPLSILYLWAVKAYKPTVKNRKWIGDKAKEVKASVEAGDDKYRRITKYDEIVSLLFPELKKNLMTRFGA